MDAIRNALAMALLAAAVGGLAVPASAAEEASQDAFVCMEETQEKCDYENKNMELFIQGRDAFDRGREIGDFREAHDYAAELLAREDLRHGKGLMKFIYLQLAQGAHKNLVEAYRWVAADIAAGMTYPRLDLERVLAQVAARMTPEQLAEAKR
ncbi:MAG: hypothetical protein K2X67_20635 [Burkholderiales bacterium]|jgi:hypothetical protein|nr:hypothetical protein [Burkholderiales bacterium]